MPKVTASDKIDGVWIVNQRFTETSVGFSSRPTAASGFRTAAK